MENNNNNEEKEKTLTEIRLSLGEAWMFCCDCGVKLYSFDGFNDKMINCPTPKECKEQNRKNHSRFL